MLRRRRGYPADRLAEHSDNMTEHTITEHIEGTGHANRKRSLAKTLSWRILASTDTVIIARVLTGSWTIGLSIASIEIVTKMILYYLHERGWSKWDWGLEDVDVDAKALELRPVH